NPILDRLRADPARIMSDGGLSPDVWQSDVLRSTADRLLFLCSRQAGKALAVDTPIAPPGGWTTMGEVRPGDRVYDERGQPCEVMSCSETLYRPVYRVRFSDGEELIADAEHQWITLDAACRAALSRSREPVPSDWPSWRAQGRPRPARKPGAP